MHRNTWKGFERTVAEFFGTERTPLSGGNSKITRSDTLHELLFIECKQRESMATWKLWEDTLKMAIEEQKTPVLALKQNHKNGFLVVIHASDFDMLLEDYFDRRQRNMKSNFNYNLCDMTTIQEVIEGTA